MRARTPTKLDLLARCRAPHHGPQSRRRSSFSGHEKRRAPSLPSYEAVCAFSARARPFSLRLVSPRGALPLRCSPVSVSVSVSVCSEESRLTSMDISAYVRVTTRHEAKTPGKQILTTFLEISARDFDFRYETFISVRDVIHLVVVLWCGGGGGGLVVVLSLGFVFLGFFLGFLGFLGFFRFF